MKKYDDTARTMDYPYIVNAAQRSLYEPRTVESAMQATIYGIIDTYKESDPVLAFQKAIDFSDAVMTHLNDYFQSDKTQRGYIKTQILEFINWHSSHHIPLERNVRNRDRKGEYSRVKVPFTYFLNTVVVGTTPLIMACAGPNPKLGNKQGEEITERELIANAGNFTVVHDIEEAIAFVCNELPAHDGSREGTNKKIHDRALYNSDVTRLPAFITLMILPFLEESLAVEKERERERIAMESMRQQSEYDDALAQLLRRSEEGVEKQEEETPSEASNEDPSDDTAFFDIFGKYDDSNQGEIGDFIGEDTATDEQSQPQHHIIGSNAGNEDSLNVEMVELGGSADNEPETSDNDREFVEEDTTGSEDSLTDEEVAETPATSNSTKKRSWRSFFGLSEKKQESLPAVEESEEIPVDNDNITDENLNNDEVEILDDDSDITSIEEPDIDVGEVVLGSEAETDTNHNLSSDETMEMDVVEGKSPSDELKDAQEENTEDNHSSSETSSDPDGEEDDFDPNEITPSEAQTIVFPLSDDQLVEKNTKGEDTKQGSTPFTPGLSDTQIISLPNQGGTDDLQDNVVFETPRVVNNDDDWGSDYRKADKS